IHI
ncbi:hypothetical protein CFC21_011819, partial [Triticum aestivum]